MPIAQLPENVIEGRERCVLVACEGGVSGFAGGPRSYEIFRNRVLRTANVFPTLRDGSIFLRNEDGSQPEITSTGFSKGKIDSGKTIVVVHVDDFRSSAESGRKRLQNLECDSEDGQRLGEKLRLESVKIEKIERGWGIYPFLGTEVTANPTKDRRFLSQLAYLEKLKHLVPTIELMKRQKTPLSPSFVDEYKLAIKEEADSVSKDQIKTQQVYSGAALQLTKTGAHVIFAITTLCSCKGIELVLRARRKLFAYCIQNPWFKAIAPECKKDEKGAPVIEIDTYADANHGGCIDGKSNAGEVIAIGGARLLHQRTKIPAVCMSSTESELSAAVSATRFAGATIEFIRSLNMVNTIKEKEWLDNAAAITLSCGRTLTRRSRAILNKELYLREKIEGRASSHPFQLGKICGTRNPADGLTKSLGSRKFEEHAAFSDVLILPGLLDRLEEEGIEIGNWRGVLELVAGELEQFERGAKWVIAGYENSTVHRNRE